jgi:hypothetical protein
MTHPLPSHTAHPQSTQTFNTPQAPCTTLQHHTKLTSHPDLTLLNHSVLQSNFVLMCLAKVHMQTDIVAVAVQAASADQAAMATKSVAAGPLVAMLAQEAAAVCHTSHSTASPVSSRAMQEWLSPSGATQEWLTALWGWLRLM